MAESNASVDATNMLMFQYSRHQRRASVYDIVFNRCLDKISRSAKQGSTCCLFDIPPFIMGLPMFNRTECLVYVVDLLKLRGFVVHIESDLTFTVSWSVHDCRLRSSLSNIHNEQVAFLPFHPSPRLKTCIETHLYLD